MVAIVKEASIEVTPEELAEAFTDMNSTDQAAFFAKVWQIASEWPGAGWCQQSSMIVRELGKDGRDAVRALAEHLAIEEAEPQPAAAPRPPANAFEAREQTRDAMERYDADNWGCE